MSNEIIVYSTTTCPYCYKVKDFLTKNGIKFTEKKVDMDETALQEMMDKTKGHMGVPVLDIKGTMILGYDEEAIKKALGLSPKKPLK